MFVIRFLFLKGGVVASSGIMFVGCCLSKREPCFLRAPDVPPPAVFRLVKFLGAPPPLGSVSRGDGQRTRTCVKVIFFFPAFRATTEEVKKLDSGFLLFVLTNKNLCLKPRVGFFFISSDSGPGVHGAHELTPPRGVPRRR